MVNDQRTSLPLRFNDEDVFGELSFVARKPDLDGIWVDVEIATIGFKTELSWFLASTVQGSLAGLYSDFVSGRSCPQFILRDTDCSFAATFTPNLASGIVNVAIEIRCCLTNTGSAISVDLNHATSSMSDFQTMLQKIIAFR